MLRLNGGTGYALPERGLDHWNSQVDLNELSHGWDRIGRATNLSAKHVGQIVA